MDLALQDLQVDDAAAGSGTSSELARGRQGVKRDMDEAGSSAKRRKEFHPQVLFEALGIFDTVQLKKQAHNAYLVFT